MFPISNLWPFCGVGKYKIALKFVHRSPNNLAFGHQASLIRVALRGAYTLLHTSAIGNVVADRPDRSMKQSKHPLRSFPKYVERKSLRIEST